jgi:hypothetical protein
MRKRIAGYRRGFSAGMVAFRVACLCSIDAYAQANLLPSWNTTDEVRLVLNYNIKLY